jgi:magnesium chelatase family protein
MLAQLKTYTLVGIHALPVEVEVDVSGGEESGTVIVGLPEGAVRESTHRVARALANSGFHYPIDRVVINLAPAEVPKQAASFDLPISLGMMAASGQLEINRMKRYAVVGELSLCGEARSVRGVLSMALAAAQQEGVEGLVVPASNGVEAAVVEGLEIIPVGSLAEAAAFFGETLQVDPLECSIGQLYCRDKEQGIDFADVRGQEMAKRAFTIAAAGAHNLLMLGPPGSGKTMLAKRVPSVMPPLSPVESLETTRIYSAVGKLGEGRSLITERPFRAPHHTISDVGLVGGGRMPMPGEISLAHNGVLFMDELPEFSRRTLEVMRQPLEDGMVTISRALQTTDFPADFMLIAALNPCPCGYRTDSRRVCRCTPPQVERYMAKVSGPLLDRIDIHIEVPAVKYEELASDSEGTTSREMREIVERARRAQGERFDGLATRFNAQMTSRQTREFCRLDKEGCQQVRRSLEQLGFSARAYDKILRLARTIADVEEQPEVLPAHVSEAINYRTLDRQM